jgi:signal transduction histidine kinase
MTALVTVIDRVDHGVMSVPGATVARTSLAPVMMFVVAAVAIVVAYAVERGNAPYTLNFLEPADLVVVTVMFSVGVLGTVVLLMRPGHRTGQVMLWSGFCWAMGLVCHAAAVRMVLVRSGAGIVADTATWVATFAFVPAFGLLTFVPATWPTGRVDGRWLRALAAVAGVALVLMTVAQAFAPDHLDGVRHHVIANPLGVPILAGPVAVATSVAGVCLAVFAVVSLADLVRRAVSSRGDLRRPYRPVLGALAFATLAAAGTLPWLGGTKALFVGAGIAVAGSSLAIGVATAAMGRSERVERARARLVAERETERARLRRELHDGVGPLLAALRLEIDVLGGEAATARARMLLCDAIAEVRRISRDLRPVVLDELGLAAALRHQSEVLEVVGGPTIHVALPDELPVLPDAVEVAVVRIAGEALTNVVRHASAARCVLRLDVGTVIRLEVGDDGVGAASAEFGVGVRSMMERAAELGGRCEVGEAAGGGTLVKAVLPWQ